MKNNNNPGDSLETVSMETATVKSFFFPPLYRNKSGCQKIGSVFKKCKLQNSCSLGDRIPNISIKGEDQPNPINTGPNKGQRMY